MESFSSHDVDHPLGAEVSLFMLETRVPGLLQLIPVIDLGMGIDRIELLALPLGSTCIIEAAVFGATIPANPETFFIAMIKSETR